MINAEIKSKIDEDISILLKLNNHKYYYLSECGLASNLNIGDYIKIRAVFISHTHIDHFINFDNILRFQLRHSNKIVICGPKGIAQNVYHKIKAYTWNLVNEGDVEFEIREILEDNRIIVYRIIPPIWNLEKIVEYTDDIVYKNNSFFVKYTLLDHKINSVAYLFQEPGKIKIENFPYKPGKWINQLKDSYKAKDEGLDIDVHGEIIKSKFLFQYLYEEAGYKLGIIMDHLASEENHNKIKELFFDVDELFIECYYREIDKDFALTHHHSTASRSGKLAKELNVKKLNPIHFSKRYLDEIEDIKEEALAAFEGRSPKFIKKPEPKY